MLINTSNTQSFTFFCRRLIQWWPKKNMAMPTDGHSARRHKRWCCRVSLAGRVLETLHAILRCTWCNSLCQWAFFFLFFVKKGNSSPKPSSLGGSAGRRIWETRPASQKSVRRSRSPGIWKTATPKKKTKKRKNKYDSQDPRKNDTDIAPPKKNGRKMEKNGKNAYSPVYTLIPAWPS